VQNLNFGGVVLPYLTFGVDVNHFGDQPVAFVFVDRLQIERQLKDTAIGRHGVNALAVTGHEDLEYTG